MKIHIVNANLVTILLTYSFVQGFISSGYLLIKLKRPFLAIALASVSLLILVFLYERYQWFLEYPQFIWMFPPVWYIIGPAYYFFIRAHFGIKLKRLDLLHLLPVLFFYIYLFPFYLLETGERIQAFNDFWTAENYTIDPHHYAYQLHLLVYAVLSIRLVSSSQASLKEKSAESSIINNDFIRRVIYLLITFCAVGLVYYVIVDLKLIPPSSLYTPVVYISLSLLIHLTTYYTWSGKKWEQDQPIMKYTTSGLDEIKMQAILDTLIEHIKKEDVYRNPDLRLRDVSEALDVPSHHLSQTINMKLSKSFFDIVNEQRVKAFKENSNNAEYRNYTLVGIAEEFGFKSSSSFYRIFKKVTGQTPKEYLKSAR